MPHTQYVAVPLPEGRRLGDLFGIDEDLLACRDFIDLYRSLSEAKRSPENFKMIDCVVTAVFIRYGRCFGSGVRSSTQRELKQAMDSDDLLVHQLAMNFRNKHYAHSINVLEAPEITVSLTMDSPKRAVTSVSVANRGILAPDMFVFDNLRMLIDKLRKWALAEQKGECARLLPLIKDRYTIDDLYSMIDASKPRRIQYGDIAKPRKGT